MSKTPLILWGAAGHAKVLREFLEPAGYRLVALFDNDLKRPAPYNDAPLYRGMREFTTWLTQESHADCCFLIAVGGARGNERIQLHEQLERHGLKPIVAIHPSAFVAENATLGSGSQILTHACVCVDARLGRCCIVNTAATVDHESELEDGVHVAPGAHLCGLVKVGAYSLIGPGAVVLPRVRVGSNAIVGAGSVVTRDIPDGVVAFGSPARVIRENRSQRS